MMRRFASGPEVAKQSRPSIRLDRVALLVGNAAYPGRRLGTPVHDVEVLKGVLNLLRFDVAVVTDATKAQFETAIAQFGERIDATAPAALSFFYFAGHGIQHDTTNYLLPVDIEDISSTRHLPAHAISIEDVVGKIINSNCRENVIILDACRDNPLGGALRLRRAAQGLARLLAPPPGTLIAFSTASGAVAADGDGSNSPYLEALADELLQAPAHATIGDVFHSVSKRLQHRTEQAQSPALYIQGHLETVIRPWADLLPDAAVGAERPFVRVSVGLGDQPDQVRAMIPGTGLNQWFKDFQHGPEMVMVPPGSFLMGGNGDNQTPEHEVTIAEPFAVSRFAITKAINVAAYAAATGAIRQLQPRRAWGSAASRTSAATPERKQATCQPVRVADLMAAPPVENRIAAATSSSRLRIGEAVIASGRRHRRQKPQTNQGHR